MIPIPDAARDELVSVVRDHASQLTASLVQLIGQTPGAVSMRDETAPRSRRAA